MSAAKAGKKNSGHNGANGSGCLSDHVKQAMDRYFADMEGHEPADLYKLILTQVEVPLFQTVLDYTGGNVSKAAEVLGLNRGTLRNRLRKYKLE